MSTTESPSLSIGSSWPLGIDAIGDPSYLIAVLGYMRVFTHGAVSPYQQMSSGAHQDGPA
jgi:hypothetical protein